MTRRLIVCWGLVTVLGTACGAGDGEGDSGQDQVAAGEEAFRSNCMACHGVEGRGSDAGPPLVHEVYEPGHHDDESFRRAVREGVVPHHWNFGPMPPYPNLPEDDVEAIIVYVRGLQQQAGIQ